MILRFGNKNSIGKNVEVVPEETVGTTTNKQACAEVDYSREIVEKPWGYEYLIFENEHVAIWMLHIVRKRKTSMHCHPNKTTALILLSGNATCD